MGFSFIVKGCLYLPFALVPQACGRNPFPMEEKLTLCSKADDIILFQIIELQKHLVVIVAPVQDKSGLAKQRGGVFHGRKSHIIDGSEIFFFGGMDFGKDTDGMIIVCQEAGFRDMIALLINAFCICAFGAVPDKSEGFKMISVRLCDVGIIDMDNRLIGNPFATNV